MNGPEIAAALETPENQLLVRRLADLLKVTDDTVTIRSALLITAGLVEEMNAGGTVLVRRSDGSLNTFNLNRNGL